ncbi:hypothetical protein EVAR_61872_1 [Eumeta japonica]|uniref:Uncharacterized protein n=1 Tax=Eumeta variegata TaxID=151549 RepID=A0A4C1ZN48_EUMVA|nr:hypothetical protein EVAR_61872_1 [Eumeta japonica]
MHTCADSGAGVQHIYRDDANMLKWLQKDRNKHQIDQLLLERKNVLKQTDKLLEKWKHTQASDPTQFEETRKPPPPLRLELPLVEMTLFNAQEKHPERGDTGDLCERTESTFLTFSPLLDENAEEVFSENILMNHTERFNQYEKRTI